MKPISRAEVLSIADYEPVRERFRQRIIEEKRVRRLELGEHMTVLFENRDTVLFQIQEMLRTERITAESGITHEIETYNTLIPTADEVSATVFIAYPERDERERMLRALAGVEDCFSLWAKEHASQATGEERGERTDRTTAVQYLKFPLNDALRAALLSDAPAEIRVDHDHYRAAAAIEGATRAALRADLEAS